MDGCIRVRHHLRELGASWGDISALALDLDPIPFTLAL